MFSNNSNPELRTVRGSHPFKGGNNIANIKCEIRKMALIEGYNLFGLYSQRVAHLQFKLHRLQQSAPTPETLQDIAELTANIKKWSDRRDAELH